MQIIKKSSIKWKINKDNILPNFLLIPYINFISILIIFISCITPERRGIEHNTKIRTTLMTAGMEGSRIN